MSTFWAAVASERALLIASDPGTHGLEAAYDWRSFNATPRENYTSWNGGPLLSDSPRLCTSPSIHPAICCFIAVLLLQHMPCRPLSVGMQKMGGFCMQRRACWPSGAGTGGT